MSPRIIAVVVTALVPVVPALLGAQAAPRPTTAPAAAPAAAPAVAPAAAPAAPPPPRAGWVELARTTAIAASLDTGRVERASDGGVRVWYRFAYATPLALGDDATTRYGATEMRMQLDCAARRARTLDLRMIRLDDVAEPAPASDQSWKGFAEHPMGQGVFVAGCAALGTPAPK